MEDYHKYVFDEDNRCFVGDFDGMYKAESKAGFDSWHQDDMRDITNTIVLSILSQYNRKTILDIGCEKGMFTQCLKKRNNSVVGLDLSDTAIKVASCRFPDISFRKLESQNLVGMRIY